MATTDWLSLLVGALVLGVFLGAAFFPPRRDPPLVWPPGREPVVDDADADIVPFGLGYSPPLAPRRPWLPGDTHGRNTRLTDAQRHAVWERSRQERRHA